MEKQWEFEWETEREVEWEYWLGFWKVFEWETGKGIVLVGKLAEFL
jgi:hypothetical protein